MLFSKGEIEAIRKDVAEKKEEEEQNRMQENTIIQEFTRGIEETYKLFVECMLEYPDIARAYGKKPVRLPYRKRGMFDSAQSEELYFFDTQSGYNYYVTAKGNTVFTTLDSVSRSPIIQEQCYERIQPVNLFNELEQGSHYCVYGQDVKGSFSRRLPSICARWSFEYDELIESDDWINRTVYVYKVKMRRDKLEIMELIKEYMKRCASSNNGLTAW